MQFISKTIFIFFFSFFGWQTYSQSTAVNYMDKIAEETKNIQTDMWDYTNAVSHGRSARKVEKRRLELLNTSKQALHRVKNMPAYNGSTVYRDSVVSFLRINYLVLNEEYATIVDLEAIAENSYNNMEAYLMSQEAASTKMKEASEMVKTQQLIFADKNEIELIVKKDELSLKMDIAGKVYSYYNKIYLLFFKCYILEPQLFSAIENQENNIDEIRIKLIEATKEGLKTIAEMESFNGDYTLLKACENLLLFYKDEAEKKVYSAIEYHKNMANYSKSKEKFEGIKEKDRTNDDINSYNNSIAELNVSVEVFNATNEILQKDRKKYLETWNKAVVKFTDKHVPQGKAK